MALQGIVKKSIFAHFIIALNYTIKNTLVKAGFLLSWNSAEMGFLGLASVGVSPSRSPWGACPGVPPWASWGLISNNRTAVLLAAV